MKPSSKVLRRKMGEPMRPLCSLAVLAALGVLAFAAAPAAQAQTRPTLTAGALPVLRGVVSGQAVVNAPVATSTGRLLTIDQQSQRAIIDWQYFNIGSGSEVRFNQPSSTASALNRIYSLDPSIIQGKLSANGQVLLINQNGILFDRGAQVNVQSLVASTLNLSNDRFLSGALTTGGLTTPAFAGGYDDAGNTLPLRPDGTRPGAITLGADGAAGAAAPTLKAAQGGSILLVAPNIDNAGGVIAAPDGQVILAAGSKAWLVLPDQSDNTGLRGMRVEVEASPDAPLNLSSLIRNAGDISAARGNVTLAALAINQEGRVSASTAIQANGTVFLQARSKDGTQAGSVHLAQGSTTEVRPDVDDKATLPQSQSYADRRGQIVVQGRTIESQGTLIAPGGQITLNASDAADPTGARVYLDQGSLTSVAGNWADVAYADNLLTFKVTSNELKDSPDQKLGILKGATVTVDLRKGSPLLDLSGYVGAQGRTVSQKTATGGALSIVSSGSLIQREGATLDASGGGYLYGGGTAATTKLLGADGKIYDIGSAPEALTYTAQLDRFDKRYPRWGNGVTESFTGLLYGTGGQEAAYAEGKPGGSINLQSAAGLVLDGALKGGVTVGPNQLAKAPRGAALTIGNLDSTNDFVSDQRIGNVSVVQRPRDTLGSGFTVDSALSAARTQNVTLAADQLFGQAASTPKRGVYEQSAFDTVEIDVNGRVRVENGVKIDGAPGSTFTVRAPQIDIAGTVDMPAGTITLQPIITDRPSPDLDASRGVTVRGSAVLSTAGNWINNASADGSFVGGALPSARLNIAADGSTSSMLDGGSLTLAAGIDKSSSTPVSSTLLERGARLDVSGGGALDRNGRLTGGNGGSLSIANGLSSALSSDWMQASLAGFAVGNGGKLSLSTPRAQIAPADANGTLPANTTRFTAELFSEHGFSSISLSTLQGIDIQAGTSIALQQKNLVVDSVEAKALPTGGDIRSVSTMQRLTDDVRQSVNLTLSTAGTSSVPGAAVLKMADTAQIVADPKAKITLSAVDGMSIGGRIAAPGGNVTLQLKAPDPAAQGTVVVPDLQLGPKADISVNAAFVAKPNANGLAQGTMVDAGTITISALNAGVNLAAGSKLSLDGLATEVESLDSGAAGGIARRHVDGNAGTLALKSQGALNLGSSLSARRGSGTGAGGSFSIELKAPDSPLQAPPLDERRIVVSQAGTTAAAAPGFVDTQVSTDTLSQAGFDKLRLLSENRIEFRGDTSAAFARGVRLDAPLIDVRDDARVSLSGATVSLGQSLDPRNPDHTRAPQGAPPVLPTRAGGGLLTVDAGTIDLYGSLTVNGVVETRLFADGDIRLTGRGAYLPAQAGQTQSIGQVGSFTSAGDLTLRAAQVYPSTRTDFTLSVASQPGGALVPGGTISIASNGNTPGDAYSAGGKLTLNADNIVQAGTLKAPQGALVLNAGSSLELAPGSLTSVSSGGLTVPYGTTQAGLNWQYQDGPGLNTLSAPSAQGKQLSISGKRVAVDKGATVDLTGGGDVAAIEWVPGSGGSKDTLLKDNTYAIIPKSRLTSMPVDADIASRKDLGFGLQTANPDASVYDSLVIGSGAAVPAGEYVLLPGRYALLPGAYLVQLQTGGAYAAMNPGQTLSLPNGQTVVAGYRTARGTGVRESRTVGVVVRPGSDALRESDYTVTGSQYFADQAARDRVAAPRLPIDAGRLTLSNVSSLSLDGAFNTAPGQVSTATSTSVGRGAQVDISAGRIAVVDPVGSGSFGADVLQLDGKRLSALGSSILLGGQRTDTADGMQITTSASDIVVANSAAGALKAPELLFSAKSSIDVRAGSVLAGTGSDGAAISPQTIKAEAGGALMRLSAGAQASVDRGTSPDASTGEIRIAAGATLSADKSLLLDATRTTRSQGNLQAGGAGGAGGSLSLASSQVSLGQTDGVAGLDQGLVLSNRDLAGLASLDALAIKGYQGIDLYGSANVGAATLGSLTLDAPALRGRALPGAAAPAAAIAARQVRWVNAQGGSAGAASASAGMLGVQAERIVIGAGDKTLSGYGEVAMSASGGIVGDGKGRTATAARWTLSAPSVAMNAGANQQWLAADLQDPAAPVFFSLAFTAPAGAQAPAAFAAAGGRLAAQGSRVSVATTLQARSGRIELSAVGISADDAVTLASGASLDVSGTSKDYHGNVVTADAGSVRLASASGQVNAQTGSTIDLSADAHGGNAGTLQVQAKTLALQGTLKAGAADGATGGSAAIDVASLSDFSVLNQRLNEGGFSGSRELRVRGGNVAVAASDVVKARDIRLSADAGRIDIAGTLDASGKQGGGSINLWASQGLSLAAGSRVLANGTSTDAGSAAPLASGGTVRVSTTGGTLAFDAASTVDVSPGAKGRTGSVTFGVSRDANNVVGATALAGTVLGKSGGNGQLASVVLEAQRSYDVSGSILAGDIAGYASDHAAFIASADASTLLGSLKGDGGVSANASLRGATQLRSNGDLFIASAWDLTNTNWLANGQPGTLTLRAAGNVTISSSVGSPNDNLLAGQTWNLRVVGGADLSAADPLATRAADASGATGNVVLNGNAAKLRTGTGSIDIAAATDFRMTGQQSVVYTAGRIGAADTASNGNNRWSQDGGSISIRTGRNASGASDEWITEWLRRPRMSANASVTAEWWVYRPNFQQGVGTLGGGDIRIAAGGNVENLSAMLPTTGRRAVDEQGAARTDVQGGGNLAIDAGGDVRGGAYLVGRGRGAVHAGAAVGAGTPTQLFMMGVSSGNAPEQANVRIEAGQGIALQSVSNPTAVYMTNSIGTGPSFGAFAGNQASTFFTYSSNSALQMTAKSGDVSLGTGMAAARTLVAQSLPSVNVGKALPYPVTLTVAALDGNVAGSSVVANPLVTYPSAGGRLALLAQGSVEDISLKPSDLAPSAVNTIDNPNRLSRQLTIDNLASSGPLIVDRPASDGFTYDIQAITGSVRSTRADAMVFSLPAKSRVRAGTDIRHVTLTLQNLTDADVSEVRADQGDIRADDSIEIRGPGRLLVQAGRNIDLGPASRPLGTSGDIGGLTATGNNSNSSLPNSQSARITAIAGVTADVDLAKLDASYAQLIALNARADEVLAFYRTLNGDPDRGAVLAAGSVSDLAVRDKAYSPYVDLGTKFPRVLAAYQAALKSGSLPLAASPEATQAAELYAQLNRETNVAAITGARGVADLVSALPDGAAYQRFAGLDAKYPRVFADYRARRAKGAQPAGLTPIVFSDVLHEIVAGVVPDSAVSSGGINSYLSSIQTYGGSDIDLWAPGGNIVVGLTTPSQGKTIGVLTNAGGAIRSVLNGDFSINQGKVLTAQGGDIMLFSEAGSIDAGRGAKTSISTPPPKRTPVFQKVNGQNVLTGYVYTLPASASGSGIQTLTSSPGPGMPTPPAGSIYLFAPAGTIDAGEAGIRSGGNIVINAQTVLNATNISASGSSAGVPQVQAGSPASSLAASGANTVGGSKAAEDASAAAAAKAAATGPVVKPNILSVEVLGFGDKNCREGDKDCFAK